MGSSAIEGVPAAGIASSATLDQIAAPAGNVSFAGFKATLLGTPTAAGDAAPKSYVDAQIPIAAPAMSADPHLGYTVGGGQTAAVVTTALVPTFYRIQPQGHRTYPLSQLGARLTAAGAGGSTMGLAVYSITWTNSTTWAATLVAQLNAAAAATAAGFICGDVTTGAVGSGAGVATLDFVNNHYVVGHMASTATTLAFAGVTVAATNAGYGLILGTVRASTTDWPSTFDQTTTSVIGGQRITFSFLKTAVGKLLP